MLPMNGTYGRRAFLRSSAAALLAARARPAHSQGAANWSRYNEIVVIDAQGFLLGRGVTLPRALADFRHCRRADPNHPKAPGAIRKITQRLCRRASGSFVDLFGPLVIFIAGTVVFLFAQLDFVFREASIRSLFGLPVKISVIDNAMV